MINEREHRGRRTLPRPYQAEMGGVIHGWEDMDGGAIGINQSQFGGHRRASLRERGGLNQEDKPCGSPNERQGPEDLTHNTPRLLPRCNPDDGMAVMKAPAQKPPFLAVHVGTQVRLRRTLK